MFKIQNIVFIISCQSDFKDQLSVYQFIYSQFLIMSKVLKPQKSPLKFDTSSANIGCFIRGKSKHKSIQNDLYITASQRKKVLKNQRRKQIQFQDKAFLQSVVCKILNDADCKGITELIDSMAFPVTNTVGKQNNKNNRDDQIEEDQISQIFNDFKPFNSHYQSNHMGICRQKKDQYRVIPPSFASYAKQNLQQKHQRTTTLQSTLISSPKSELNPQIPTLFLPSVPLCYGLNYYNQGSYIYPRQLTQRKKKNSEGEQIYQYKIIPEKIDEDGRTTLMIRHIPNKYTQDVLYEEISRNHKMKINFLYLPIDNYNSCNVGYAFVNFINTKFICDFYKEFNRRRWDRFNSEKICELAYARIQGTTNLIDHFHGNHLRCTTVSNNQQKKCKSLLDVDQSIKEGSQNIDFPKPDGS